MLAAARGAPPLAAAPSARTGSRSHLARARATGASEAAAGGAQSRPRHLAPGARVLVLGAGFLGSRVAAAVCAAGGDAHATYVGERGLEEALGAGAPARVLGPFAGAAALLAEQEGVQGFTHVLSTVPPEEGGGDAALRLLEAAPKSGAFALEGVRWVGYCSSTSVYDGDGRGLRAPGAVVDEGSACAPRGEAARRRLRGEVAWGAALASAGWEGRLRVFRLGALYGPGRSVLDAVRREGGEGGEGGGGGTTGKSAQRRRLSPRVARIHVDDAVAAVLASMAVAMDEEAARAPQQPRVYNLVDDDDAPRLAALRHASRLLGLPPPECPPEAPPPDADKDKRVSNARMKAELGVRLRFPSFREGLAAALSAEEEGRAPKL